MEIGLAFGFLLSTKGLIMVLGDDERRLAHLEAIEELSGELRATRPTHRDPYEYLGPLTEDHVDYLISGDSPSPLFLAVSGPEQGTHYLYKAAAAIQQYPSNGVVFSVLTNRLDNWQYHPVPVNLLDGTRGIHAVYHDESQQFILSLTGWKHGGFNKNLHHILLIDDLADALNTNFDTRQHLRHIILHGPKNLSSVIATYQKDQYQNLKEWIKPFRDPYHHVDLT